MFLNVKCHIISCMLELIDGPGPSCIYTVFISAFQGYICITSTKDTDTLSLLKYKKKKKSGQSHFIRLLVLSNQQLKTWRHLINCHKFKKKKQVFILAEQLSIDCSSVVAAVFHIFLCAI